MIISEFQTFLIVILDNIKHCLIILSCLSFLFSIACLFISKDSSTTIDEEEWLIKWSKKIAVLFCILVILATIVPNTKQMLQIIIIPKIVNNEQIQNLSTDAIQAISLLINGVKDEPTNDKTDR